MWLTLTRLLTNRVSRFSLCRSVVNAALGLGMNVIGYDPVLSLEAAWRLPGDKMSRADDLDELFALADYITIHVPYIKGVTHHLIDAKALAKCKPGVNLLNFARGEIIDGSAVRAGYDAGKLTGKYVSDFSDPDLMGHPRHIVLPHLGASTEEAEENSAAMAADTMMDFLETGTIRNSVNFPTTILPPHRTPPVPVSASSIRTNPAPSVRSPPSSARKTATFFNRSTPLATALRTR